mmetsp:Transcript_32568/g.32876  ORF Transcript_32568/g.32876 Transcript_32568/m.32876 type:complete len:194 (-) Transcript_32568:516-1097(-)
MKQVRSLNLHGQGMEGAFPVVLTQLPYIQTLSLQWNNFTGDLPEEIGSMKHLIHTELHYNKLTGSFPNTWSNARNLQLLNLANNFLTGQLPQDVGKFRNIKGLFIYGNNFSGTLPPELSQAKTMCKYNILIEKYDFNCLVAHYCYRCYRRSNIHCSPQTNTAYFDLITHSICSFPKKLIHGYPSFEFWRYAIK